MGTARRQVWLLVGTLIAAFPVSAVIAVHGTWVWKSPSVLGASSGAKALLDFCQSEGINEVYVSTSGVLQSPAIADLVARLHQSHIRVEGLLSSIAADEPGTHRDKLLGEVEEIVQFNRNHPKERFDGIHLDIEPQQRPENKGTGNLRFLPDLVNTYLAVRVLAEPKGLTVNADIPTKFLKGEIAERKMLLSALPRLTLMLYELSSPGDGVSTSQKTDKLVKNGRKFLETAYQGISGANLAMMSIALRTADYGNLFPTMLKTLDDSFHNSPHYLGWAWHSYNDVLKTVQ